MSSLVSKTGNDDYERSRLAALNGICLKQARLDGSRTGFIAWRLLDGGDAQVNFMISFLVLHVVLSVHGVLAWLKCWFSWR